jgi:hypothetical protein
MNATLTIITDGDRQNLIDANGEVVYYIEPNGDRFSLYTASGQLVTTTWREFTLECMPGWAQKRHLANQGGDLPVNVEFMLYGEPMMMYRPSITKSGRYRVAAHHSIPAGVIGVKGKSFATKEERDAAVEESCKLLDGRNGWKMVRR